MYNTKKAILFFFLVLYLGMTSTAQDAKEIVQKVQDKELGKSSESEITMKIIRPDWTREVGIKSWTKGDDFALMLITSPARDKGVAFLKRGKEIWNWQPNIDRAIKLPPSMMTQSWMGSDFTNDDLVNQSSTVDDYEHTLLEPETIDDRPCYVVQLVPKEGTAVVWDRIVMWVDQKEYIQLKAEFYDEDDYLINTMYGKNVKKMGGKMLPSVLEVVPADEEGHKTIIEYLSLTFDTPITESFFSIRNLKRVN